MAGAWSGQSESRICLMATSGSLLRLMLFPDSFGQTGHSRDDGVGPGRHQLLCAFGRCGVADARCLRGPGGRNVGWRVADHGAGRRHGAQFGGCLLDQVRAGLENGRVMAGARGDSADLAGEFVYVKVGANGTC